MKIALLGCGRVAEHYADKVLNKIKNIEVVSCCDLILKKSKKISKKFECTYYTNELEMYKKENIDFVFILTESGNHYKNTLNALKNNVNVLVEKPVTLIVSQAYKLDKIAKSKGLIIENVFQNRLNPAIQKLKEAFVKKKFGKIVSCSINLKWRREQSYYNDGWHGTWLMDGGVINQQAIHHLDVLNWICGPIKRVVATKANIKNKLEAEDTMIVLVDFQNGYAGSIESSTAANDDIEASISIYGTNGHAKISGIALNEIEKWSFLKGKDLVHFKKNYSQIVENGYGLSHITLVQNLVKNFNKKSKKINLSITESVKTLKLVHSIYKSVEEKRWVYIDSKNYSKKLGRDVAKITK